MTASTLPKSLHTVRILVAVATFANVAETELGRILDAASVIGYPNASAADPVIIKASEQLRKSTLRAVA